MERFNLEHRTVVYWITTLAPQCTSGQIYFQKQQLMVRERFNLQPLIDARWITTVAPQCATGDGQIYFQKRQLTVTERVSFEAHSISSSLSAKDETDLFLRHGKQLTKDDLLRPLYIYIIIYSASPSVDSSPEFFIDDRRLKKIKTRFILFGVSSDH